MATVRVDEFFNETFSFGCAWITSLNQNETADNSTDRIHIGFDKKD